MSADTADVIPVGRSLRGSAVGIFYPLMEYSAVSSDDSLSYCGQIFKRDVAVIELSGVNARVYQALYKRVYARAVRLVHRPYRGFAAVAFF